MENTKFEARDRAEAFTYMLNKLIGEGTDPLEAAKKANEFAEIFAVNMGIPLNPEPKLQGVDKYISGAEKIGKFLEEHPKIIELGIPVVTFIAGLFTGKKVEQCEDQHSYHSIRPPENQPPLDIENLK